MVNICRFYVTSVICQQWLTDLKPVTFLLFYRKKRLQKYHNKFKKRSPGAVTATGLENRSKTRNN